MTDLYLIRHTEAEGNLFRAMQGHWDGDVTALGLKEIDALAARFADVEIDALYASDLKRARLTAGAILRTHALELHTVPALREINVGPWEARFFADVGFEQPREMDLFINHAEELVDKNPTNRYAVLMLRVNYLQYLGQLYGDEIFLKVIRFVGEVFEKLLDHTETYGYIPVSELPEAEFHEDGDYALVPEAAPQSYVTCKPGMFAIFFPQDGHAPLITDEAVLRKAIFKVKN